MQEVNALGRPFFSAGHIFLVTNLKFPIIVTVFRTAGKISNSRT